MTDRLDHEAEQSDEVWRENAIEALVNLMREGGGWDYDEEQAGAALYRLFDPLRVVRMDVPSLIAEARARLDAGA